MRQVDLFAGLGGFACAGEAAGLEVVAAANHWPLAVEVHALNHPAAEHYCQDLRQFDFAQLPQFELLTAGVACQGHSRGGRQGRKNSKKVAEAHEILRSTAWAVVDCLEVCRPKFVIVENVPEFLDWTLYEVWIAALRKLGYAMTSQVLCASRWEVGQRRYRVFVVGIHEGEPVHVRDPDVEECGVEGIFDESIGGWIRIEDMRRTISKRGHKTAREKVQIANERLRGALGWGQHTNYNAWGRSMSEPCPTLTTKPAMLWWVRDGQYRLWHRSELAAAMSLPRGYRFGRATRTQSSKLIGNAVPKLMAQGVIEAIVR